MPELLALSSRLIDTGDGYEGPGSVNRVTTEISEVADGIALVESFSHVVAFDSGEGLVLFDTSIEGLAQPVLKSLRSWSSCLSPVSTNARASGIHWVSSRTSSEWTRSRCSAARRRCRDRREL